MNPREFGTYLKGLRKTRGLTLTQLGELIGYSNPYLSQIENGLKGFPSPELLKKLAGPLEVHYADLMVRAGHYNWLDTLIEEGEEGLDKDTIEVINRYSSEISKKRNELTEILSSSELRLNGKMLSKSDRIRILTMLNLMFPDN